MRARFAILVATVVTFARALPYPLQRTWDDGRFLIDNPDVQHPSWTALHGFFTRVQFEAYHPLHLLSYWLDVPWFGLSPFALHAVSLVLWILALWSLHALFLELGLSQPMATLGTLLCGLHPVQVEAVCWATGRKDVLALLFACNSLLWCLRSQKPFDKASWLGLGFFLLAGLSKTSALALPLFALLLDVLPRQQSWGRALVRQLPQLLLAALLGVIVIETWLDHEMVRTTLGGIGEAPKRVAATLGFQLATAFWPARISPMYPASVIAEPETFQWLALAAFLVACACAIAARARLTLAGLLGFVLLMLPVSNLVPMYFPVQDRYLSLPLVALGLAVVGAIAQALEARKAIAAQALLGFLVVVVGVRTVQYEGLWSSPERLWGHAATTQPRAEYAWLKLGEVRRDAGQLEGAIAAYAVLVRTAPTLKLAYAALFEATALRDERVHQLAPSQAHALALRFYQSIDHADALRDFSDQLLAAGYERSIELPLTISFALRGMPDEWLAHSAEISTRGGRMNAARFYLNHLEKPSDSAAARTLLAQPYFSVLP